MKMRMQQMALGGAGVLALAMALMAAPYRATNGRLVPDRPSEELLGGSTSWTGFRIEATTDKEVYVREEVARLTVRLLNESPCRVYVGIGPDEPTFSPPSPTGAEPVPVPVLGASIPIGYVTVTQLDQGPVICTQGIRSDGTVVDTCPQIRQYSLPLFRSNQVLGHSTQVISKLEIPLGSGPWFEGSARPETISGGSTLCIPLAPGFYLLDCHIDGIHGVSEAQAQQIIEIRS